MAIQTKGSHEYVIRAVCSGCGSTGPMAKCEEAARFMAALCEWEIETGLCQQCKQLRARAKPARRRKAAKP